LCRWQFGSSIEAGWVGDVNAQRDDPVQGDALGIACGCVHLGRSAADELFSQVTAESTVGASDQCY
jgi:hypothetical protein